MRMTLFPWMYTVEERMVLNLNMTSYRRYGEKLCEVGLIYMYTVCLFNIT